MDLIFCGTSDFGRTLLKGLLASSHRLLGVVTQPDKKKGRKTLFHPVKEEVTERTLDYLQPENINSPEALSWLRERNPQIIVVAAYGQIVRKAFLNLAPQGCYNVHGSLLPHYRGASPIHYALLKGEKTTGVTVQKMVRKLDAGPVLLQKAVEILPGENFLELSARLARLGAEAIVEALDRIEKGDFELIPQDESLATYAPTLQKEEGKMDWRRGAEALENLVRGLIEWPGAWAFLERPGKDPLRLTFQKVSASQGKGSPGEILEAHKERLLVATGQGALLVEEVIPAAGKKLKARDFINGYKVEKGHRFLS